MTESKETPQQKVVRAAGGCGEYARRDPDWICVLSPGHSGRHGGDDDPQALPLTPAGIGELAMHYGEALAWIKVLEAFIVSNGLRVPTWADTKTTG